MAHRWLDSWFCRYNKNAACVMVLSVQERRWKFPLAAHENLAGALSRQGVQVQETWCSNVYSHALGAVLPCKVTDLCSLSSSCKPIKSFS